MFQTKFCLKNLGKVLETLSTAVSILSIRTQTNKNKKQNKRNYLRNGSRKILVSLAFVLCMWLMMALKTSLLAIDNITAKNPCVSTSSFDSVSNFTKKLTFYIGNHHGISAIMCSVFNFPPDFCCASFYFVGIVRPAPVL